MLIDSHAHLDMYDNEKDLDDVVNRALQGGVTHIIAVGIDVTSSFRAAELAARHECISSTVGLHPHDAEKVNAETLEELKSLGGRPEVVAWGEIGLDFFRDYSPHKTQIEAFKLQLEMADYLDLPVIIHDREAHDEVFEILNKKGGRHRGVIHCFSGDYELAMALIDMGYYISIPGTVTYKKASVVQDVAARIPLGRMLVETDAPFLAPVPRRGKRNEPAYLAHTARKIAQLRGESFEEIARRTTENAKILFSLS